MGNYTIFEIFENPRRGWQARNFTTNVPLNYRSQIVRVPNRYFPKTDVGCPSSILEFALFSLTEIHILTHEDMVNV